MTRLLLTNAMVCSPGAPCAEGYVLVEDGIIGDIGQGAPPQIGGERLDLGGLTLAPGFIDLHAHGALGRDTMDADPAALREMAAFYARHGVTSFLATTMTAPQEQILDALRAIGQVRDEGSGGAQLLGAHVEGPYIDVERRGCQDANLVRCAAPDEYGPILDTGAVRLVTLAPEYAENRTLIAAARERGVVIAAGHTRASYEELLAAVELGISQVTHMFNAMEPLHHRKPGVVGGALALDALRCEVIADNVHVHPAVLKVAVRAKGVDGIMLVTDAMSGTGMPDGEYTLGGLRVTVRGGEARLADGTLAGSTLTLDRAVANIMAAAEIPLSDAVTMATRTPARALGLEGHKGAIAPGMDADLVALDDDVRVRLTIVGGRVVYEAL